MATAAGTFYNREGLLLRYCDDTLDLVSEIAPLPGFSNESLDEALAQVGSIRGEILELLSGQFTLQSISEWIRRQTLYPSVEFGLSSIGLSVISHRERAPLHSLINLPEIHPVSVNAVLGLMDADTFEKKAVKYIGEGFHVLKCKVTGEPDHLPSTIRKLAKKYPDISFRLDANRSWPIDALNHLSALFEGLPVEYIEEPCFTNSLDQFNTVVATCRIPVAADESVIHHGLDNVIKHVQPLPYLIVKPMFFGNLIELFATIRHQYHLENRVIVTTALESAVGRRMVAMAASLAGSREMAHGLNTGPLLSDDLAEDIILKKGTFNPGPRFKGWYNFQDIDHTFLRSVW